MADMKPDMVRVEDLSVAFRVKAVGQSRSGLLRRRALHYAVNQVSFSVREGETFGLVGETGSGKSTIAKVLVAIYRPKSGKVSLVGRSLSYRNKDDLYYLRKNVGIVLQDPVGSLNPRLTIRDIIAEALVASRTIPKKDFDSRILAVVEFVGLRKSTLSMHPHELSGGEKQRASLARALAVPKKVLILDEPTSSLDMTVQAQVLNTLKTLKSELNLTYIFITHDMSVIRFMCSRVGVLFYGKLVETGPAQDVLSSPKHPYTKELLANLPSVGKRLESVETFAEHQPATDGCVYRRACPYAFGDCVQEPAMFEVPSYQGRHLVSCFLYRAGSPKGTVTGDAAPSSAP